jgi:5-methylcytosine-specific restriction protein A
MRAKKICGRLHCTRLADAGQKYCPDHKSEHDWKRNSPTDREPSRHIPAAVRSYVLQRDGHQCRIRLPGCLGAADHVDHRVAVSQGGGDHAGNLQSACRVCHQQKTSAEALAARGFGHQSQPAGPPQPRRRSSSSRSGEVQASEVRLTPIIMRYS